MLIVSVNGIIQCPGVDYHATANSVAFSSPPPAMSTIDIRGRNGILASIFGDGSTYLYQFFNDTDTDINNILEDAFKLRHVPAVADMLERLEVVVKLAKQDDRNRS